VQPRPPTRSGPSAAPPTPESTPRTTAPQPVAPSTQSGGAARPRQPAVDPWAEPAPAPAPASRSATRRRSEPPRVVGIDSLGHSSEGTSPPSPVARPQRGAEAAPAETAGEARSQ
jgi:hypothetical protein